MTASERGEPASGPPAADVEWDAGEMGCGVILMELHLRFAALKSRQVMKLIARSPGAPMEMPAWCRLTGHRLLRAEPPCYWIERKD